MNTLFLTGSSGGLGRSIREHYLERGWNVAGFDAHDDGFAHEHLGFAQIDSISETSVRTAFTTLSGRFGAPTQLIATIGGLRPWVDFEQMSFDDFSFVMNLNMTSTFVCTKEAVALMRPIGRGSIITIGAETALHPETRKAAYVAAKAAVIAFTQTIALETKEYGITANCIVPTVLHTKANESWGTPSEIPRWTKPEDIAALCEFLAGGPGAAINGSVLRVPNRM